MSETSKPLSRITLETCTTLPAVLLDMIQDYLSISISKLRCDNCKSVGTIYDVFDRDDETTIQNVSNDEDLHYLHGIDTNNHDLHCRHCHVIYFVCETCDVSSVENGQMSCTMHGADRIPMHDYPISSLCRFDGYQLEEDDIPRHKVDNPDAIVDNVARCDIDFDDKRDSFVADHSHFNGFFADVYKQKPLNGQNGGMYIFWSCLNCGMKTGCSDK